MKENQPKDKTLRQKAEELMSKKPAKMLPGLSEEEMLKLIHEIEVHQIELDMQNEELILAQEQAQEQAQIAVDKYKDLYDFAPSGYITFSKEGLILEINLRGSVMVGIERSRLINRHFVDFVSYDTRAIFNYFIENAFQSKTIQYCDIILVSDYRLAMWVHLSGIVSDNVEQCNITMIDITERKQVEEDLKNSEKNYHILANSGQALIWTSSPDKLCNYFNDVWLQFTGRSLEKELGSGWTEGVHPEDLQFCLNTYIEAFERREKFSMEYRVKRHDGVYRWIQDDGSPRYSIKGDFAGYIGHCLDVTDRKMAEESFSESEEKYRLLLENSGIGVGVFSLDGNITFFNQKAIENLGGKPEDYIGKNLKDVFGEEVGTLYINRVLSAAKSETSIEYEDFVELGSGKHWFLSNHSRIKNHKGDIIGVQVLAHDITERKLVEEEIQKISNHYQALIEKAPDGIVLINPEGNFQYISPAARKIFGYSPTEAIQGSPVSLTHPDDISMVLSYLVKLQEDPAFVPTIQYRFLAKEDNWKWIESTFTNLLLEPSVEAIVINFKDISDRKNAEEALRDVNDKLVHAQHVAKIGSWENYLPTNELTWSEEMYNIMGIPLGTPLNLFDATKIFPPEELERFQIAVSSAINDNAPYSMDYRIVRYDGSVRYIHDEGEVVHDENGTAIWMFGTTQDITERKLSDETLQDIIDKNPMSIQIVNTDGYTLKTNPAHTILFGAVPPTDFSIFMDLQSKSKELEELIILAKCGEVVHLPDLYYNAHDAATEAPDIPKWIRALIFPLKDSHGKPERFVLMHEDITERKNAEEALKEKAEQLQRFNDLMVGREIKMVDLKREINKLHERLGEPEKYVIAN